MGLSLQFYGKAAYYFYKVWIFGAILNQYVAEVKDDCFYHMYIITENPSVEGFSELYA